MKQRTDLSIFEYRAAVFCKLERWQEAIADADRAIGMEDDYQKAFLRRATAQMGLEAYEEAVRVRMAACLCKRRYCHGPWMGN